MDQVNKIANKYLLRFCVMALGILATTIGIEPTIAAEERSNACPVDGCVVKIVGVKQAENELQLNFESNFSPDVSKNHFHIWWGEKYTVKQVGRGAKAVHGVTQGRWHLTDNYPTYVTQRAASTRVRDGARTICVSAANGNHNIIDVNVYQCLNVSNQL